MTNWKLNDLELKKILATNNDPDNEEVSVSNTLKELLPHLRNTPCYNRLPKQILDRLEKTKTFHSFNRELNIIYDYCDDNKIWLGFQ